MKNNLPGKKLIGLLVHIAILLLLPGCATPEIPAKITTVIPTRIVIATVIPSNTPSPTYTPETTELPELTVTLTPGYCDLDQAMLVVARLEELTASAGNNQNDTPPSEEQVQEILAAFDEKLNELDKMDAPGCLDQSVSLLKISWIHMRQLFSGEAEGSEDVFSLLVTISEDQAAFDAEFARVKACIPTGCQ